MDSSRTTSSYFLYISTISSTSVALVSYIDPEATRKYVRGNLLIFNSSILSGIYLSSSYYGETSNTIGQLSISSIDDVPFLIVFCIRVSSTSNYNWKIDSYVYSSSLAYITYFTDNGNVMEYINCMFLYLNKAGLLTKNIYFDAGSYTGQNGVQTQTITLDKKTSSFFIYITAFTATMSSSPNVTALKDGTISLLGGSYTFVNVTYINFRTLSCPASYYFYDSDQK